MYTSGSRETALGASRLLNTPILGAAGAGQVISIIRGEGSHTYGNVVVGGVVVMGCCGDMGGDLRGQRLAAGLSHLCRGLWCSGGCEPAWRETQLQLHLGELPLFSYFVLTLFCHPLIFFSNLLTKSPSLHLACFYPPSVWHISPPLWRLTGEWEGEHEGERAWE